MQSQWRYHRNPHWLQPGAEEPFMIAHIAEAFLPPVIDMTTGTEQIVVYMPQRREISPGGPKYGSPEMTDAGQALSAAVPWSH